MSPRLSPGPVFLYETITASRRWQGYALRTLLVLAVGIALAVAWLGTEQMPGDVAALRRQLARVGENFYYGVAGVQLALALLVAPAATAGAVCLDRARGWLAHMFVTELTNTEIVLGKFTARFASVVGLVLAAVPVTAIATLMGGIIPEAIVILTLVTLAISLLGCSLAIALSVRASRAHEVLMVVFAIWSVWLLGVPLWSITARTGLVRLPPAWFFKLSPFVLAYGPYLWPGYLTVQDVILFMAAAGGLSVAALLYAIRRLRADVAPGREPGRLRAWPLWVRANLFSWWPSPSLDGNPVLWREWHRNRPTRMAKTVLMLFIVGTALGMAVGLADAVRHGVGIGGDLLEGVSFMATSFGLLILSATAPTTLTEERVRGSLDVLLTTPLPTRVIVLGKWWANYRRALPLVLLPALTGLFVAVASPEQPVWLPLQLLAHVHPASSRDRFLAGILPSAFLMAHAAAATSFGLAMATWFRRTGLAVAVSVAGFVAVSIGWIIVVVAVLRPVLHWWSNHVRALPEGVVASAEKGLLALSPIGGQISPSEALIFEWNRSRDLSWVFLLLSLAFIVLAAAILLGLTLLTFNRCLGRMDESPRTSFRAPGRWLTWAPIPRRGLPLTCAATRGRESHGRLGSEVARCPRGNVGDAVLAPNLRRSAMEDVHGGE